QEAATTAVPSDRTVVVERFRDEIGDWRLCILTPFGGRVHAPWALALGSRLRESLGLETQAIWSDDGIAIHLPEADAPPPTDDVLIDPGEVEELVVGELGDTALFGARFRENAGRSLLIPRRRPGERTPLWQQRLKAQSLLQVARKYGSFPVILETYRECLQDVFDLPALRGLLQSIQTRELDAVDVRFAGEERLIAAEDAGRYRDALGAMPPSGLPDSFLDGGPESLRQLLLRYAKGRGPFTSAQAAERFGRNVTDLLVALEAEE